MGHVTIDLISFPNHEEDNAHPFFQAIDISCELTNNAAITYFFDILMEGQLDQQTGEYSITWTKEEEYAEDEVPPNATPKNAISQNPTDNSALKSANGGPGGENTLKKIGVMREPRVFMYTHFLHHPGLVSIQYKTFFHMCRLEGISFDMESRSGSTFCLLDCL